MISIMTPTRGRPVQFARMRDSAIATARDDVQIIAYVDEDDPTKLDCDLIVKGPRDVIHSARWDKCLTLAKGEFLFHANDDIVFRTPGWDAMIADFFDKSPDKIWMVHGDDLGGNGKNFGCHPCVHRRWLDTLGYFMPPYFDGDYPDTWVNDLANRINRRKFLPFVTEHIHYLFGKVAIDQTMRERLERQEKQNPATVYKSLEAKRVEDAAKLQIAAGTPWR